MFKFRSIRQNPFGFLFFVGLIGFFAHLGGMDWMEMLRDPAFGLGVIIALLAASYGLLKLTDIIAP